VTSDDVRKSFGQAIDEIIAALEGLDPASRAVAIRAACDHVGVDAPSSTVGRATSHALAPPVLKHEAATPVVVETPTDRPRVADIRSLRAEKEPASAVEMAAVVAHYLESIAPQSERKETVTTTDLDKYFRQADFPLQKRLEQVLPNAKAAGYFDSAARGDYKLNPVGYNLVVHTLPRGVSSSARKPRIPARRKPTVRSTRRKG